MNRLRHALCVLLLATTCSLRAADSDDESPIGDFLPTNDDLVQYVPKFSVKLGFRVMGGVKANFSGSGQLSSMSSIGADTTSIQNRVYHDGSVSTDTTATVDPSGSGTPRVTNGYTNAWSYIDSSQVGNIEGQDTVSMHAYSSEFQNAGLKRDPGTSLGVELTAERQMGDLFGGRVKWGLVGGFSVNQMLSIRAADLPGKITTTTDIYGVYSAGNRQTTTPPPAAPFTGPSADTNAPVVSLNPLQPDGQHIVTEDNNATIYTRWRLRGAYLTFRAGPTLFYPITKKLSASLSAGAVLVYVGTSYDVEQRFLPTTGDEIDAVVSDGASGFLPGFYADASVQYAMTDNSGLYLGGVYQSATTYHQNIAADDNSAAKGSNYNAKVDFGSTEGVKAGFLFKF